MSAEAPAPRLRLPGFTPPRLTLPPRLERHKLLLAIALAGLALAVILFGAWYLLFRKPVSMPLPGIVTEPVPAYSFSIYGVERPTGVAVSPSGDRVYVTQSEGDRKVRIFDGQGSSVATVAPPPGSGSDHVPVYLALAPTNGDLYVSDRLAGAIYVYSKDGTYLRTVDPGSDLAGWQPLGLAFDAAGDLWVTDVSGPYNTVHEFGPDGKILRSIGAPDQFSFPNGIAVDAAGMVYVTDSNHGRLVAFDKAGQQVAAIRRGVGAGELSLPRGLSIDDEGRMYVADTVASGVQVFHVLGPTDKEPRYIGAFGAEGTQDGDFEFPFGVATDSRGRAYVADWGNDRVQIWSY